MKRYLLLAAFGLVACKKTVPVPEAGVVDASTTTTTDTSDAGAPSTDMDAAVEAAAPLTTTPTTHATTHTATGGPFQGSYKCAVPMTVTQTGSNVVAKMGDSTLTCTATGDLCDGHIVAAKGGSRHATLKRNGAGDLVYKGDGEPQPSLCRKQ